MPDRSKQQAAIQLPAGVVRFEDHPANVLSTVDGLTLSSTMRQVAI
jgi:hypothetical protein